MGRGRGATENSQTGAVVRSSHPGSSIPAGAYSSILPRLYRGYPESTAEKWKELLDGLLAGNDPAARRLLASLENWERDDGPSMESLADFVGYAVAEKARYNDDSVRTASLSLAHLVPATGLDRSAHRREVRLKIAAGMQDHAYFSTFNQFLNQMEEPSRELRSELEEQQVEEILSANKRVAEKHGWTVPISHIKFDNESIDADTRSIGKYYFGPIQEETLSVFRSAMESDQQVYSFYGDAGAGKSALVKQITAIQQKGLIKEQIGGGKNLELHGADGTVASLRVSDADALIQALQNPAAVELEDAGKGDADELTKARHILSDASKHDSAIQVQGYADGSDTIKLHPEANVFFTFSPSDDPTDPRLDPKRQDGLGLRFFIDDVPADKRNPL